MYLMGQVFHRLIRLPVCFVLAGYLFTGDAIGAMEKYSNDTVHSVMQRAESVYRNFGTNVRNSC